MLKSLELHRLINDITTVQNHLDQMALEPFGLSIVRYYVLLSIKQEPGLSFTRLSHVTLMDRASASRVVRSMEKDGLIARQLDENDRRYYSLFLTEAGQTLIEAAHEAFLVDIEARFALPDQAEISSINNSLQQTFDILIERRDALLSEKLPPKER